MKAQILRPNWLCFVLAFSPMLAGARPVRYTVILADPPMARFEADSVSKPLAAPASRAALADHRGKILAAQETFRRALQARRIPVAGQVSGLLNAVFVTANEDQLAAIEAMPGVVRVVEDRPLKRTMVKAGDLHRLGEAWRNLGGETNAGAGVRIAVLDTGIDHQHPAFGDDAMPAIPAGFPRCREADCAFTNRKVIVARSYVDRLEDADVPEISRPDDKSARDRVGHGTAVAMVAAGVRHMSPLGSVAGVAPGAWLGNYKIFGSPGVNDVAFDRAAIAALDDAVNDGMDIAVLSFGRSAIWSPSQRGSACDIPGNQPCDPLADAVENASARMLVVVAAGNDGDIGTNSPFAYNSIHTPASAPSALAVGATTNSQRYRIPVRVTGDGVPAGLQLIEALFGQDTRRLETALQAPVRDAAAIQDQGLACSPLPNGSLQGAIAVVQRGQNECSFAVKVRNAQRAGAVAVLVEQRSPSNFVFPMGNLADTGIPALMIGSTAGQALRAFLRDNADRVATIEPSPVAVGFDPDFVAFFSSLGPSIGEGAVKPEVAAVGYPLYMATQRFDPNGDLYSPSGYVAAQGTSFSAPIAAGAAAMFKQRFRTATPAQVKSAVVNTANPAVDDMDGDRVVRADVHAVGAGKVNAEETARTNLTVRESSVSFGYLTTTTVFPVGRALNLTNHSNAALNVRLASEGTAGLARVVLAETTFTLAANSARVVNVRLEGMRPAPGSYQGFITVTGGASALRVPFTYLVSDNTAANIVPLRAYDFVGETGKAIRPLFKVVDRFGVPVQGVSVTWLNDQIRGGGRVDAAFGNTDRLGIHEARLILGSQVGDQEFVAEAGGLKVRYTGRARLAPVIATDGVVNAASNQVGRGVAPGSYVAIYGRSLSEAFRIATTASLPLSLASVSVSFDAPGARSYPGRVYFVSDGQVNVQVPWELQGLNSVQMKVSIGDTSGTLYTVPLNDYSPALFEIPDPSGTIGAAALDENFRIVSSANALQRGRPGQLYCNGLGPVSNAPPTGEPSPASPLAANRELPAVTIGGRPAQVLFSGLTPSSVGLYQINIVPASDTPTGLQPVVITVGGVSSKPVNIAIR